MLIGYARTSTIEQVAGLEAQEVALGATGCTKLFSEQASSVAQRDQLTAALDFVREGDTLVVSRLDRLARSTADLLGIVALNYGYTCNNPFSLTRRRVSLHPWPAFRASCSPASRTT